MNPPDLVQSTGESAFICNQDQRIVAWNKSAQNLLGYNAERVMGRACHQFICGQDIFGNRFCREDCSAIRMVRGREPVHPFEIDVENVSGETVRARCCIVTISDPKSLSFGVLHLLAPVARRDEVAFIQEAPDRQSLLTRREHQVLGLLASGCTPREIAKSLSLSETTVRTHVHHVLHKLGVHSIAQAVATALRNGLI
jgi:PAS domain S-box-containing protein